VKNETSTVLGDAVRGSDLRRNQRAGTDTADTDKPDPDDEHGSAGISLEKRCNSYWVSSVRLGFIDNRHERDGSQER
jgi:hypothetical protein